jgi:hypothetical protein
MTWKKKEENVESRRINIVSKFIIYFLLFHFSSKIISKSVHLDGKIVFINYSLDCREGHMKKKVCRWVGVRVKGQKKISMIFPLSRSMSKNHGLGRVQRSKKHCSFRIQRSKKYFLRFFYFHVLYRKIMVLVRFKGQKKHFLLSVWVSEKHGLF